MKRELKLTTSLAAAMLAVGCSRGADDWTTQRDTAVCTDRSGKRVADANCQQQRQAHGIGGGAFLWYFLGRGARIPFYGEAARGGTFTQPSGRTFYQAPPATAVTRAGAVSRGGFGASARGFGSGRS